MPREPAGLAAREVQQARRGWRNLSAVSFGSEGSGLEPADLEDRQAEGVRLFVASRPL
jgi:hypothetical protein